MTSAGRGGSGARAGGAGAGVAIKSRDLIFNLGFGRFGFPGFLMTVTPSVTSSGLCVNLDRVCGPGVRSLF